MKKTLRYLLYCLFFFSPITLLAQANHIVISQVYGGGGNAASGSNPVAPLQNDFIELYNPTNADVDISTWSVQYQSATGTTAFSGQTPMQPNSIIKAHGYFLIQEFGSTANGVALPTADYAPTGTPSVNLSGANGKVALCNNTTVLTGAPPTSTTNVVDFVSYGVVNYTSAFVLLSPAANTNAAPALNNATSVQRLTSAASTATSITTGGTEATAGSAFTVNNNASDFLLQSTIVPHNSASVTLIPASVSSLDFGTTQAVGSPTAGQTFTIAGANLSAGATVTVTGPFTISTDGGSTYGTSKTITAAQLATTATTTTGASVLVRFTPVNTTAATGTVTIAATGAISQTVTLTGTGVAAAVPALTASVPSLAFGNQTNNTITATALSYTLTGANLSSNVNVNVTGQYLISKSPTTGFGTTQLVFNYLTDFATPPTVYVQFAPTATTGALAGSVTNTSTGVTTGPTVTLSGTSVTPTLTAPATLPFGNVTINTTATQTFTVSGTNLSADASLTVTGTGLTISTNGTFGTTASILKASLGTAQAPGTAQTVTVKYNPTTVSTLSGSISITSTGATTQAVAVTGNAVAAPVPTLTIDQSTLTPFTATVGTTTVLPDYYTITGANISGASSVTVTGPFQVSPDGIAAWGSTLNFIATDFPTNTSTKRAYFRFIPGTVVGPVTGTAVNTTASGGSPQTVTLNGTGVGVPLITAAPTTLTFSQTIATNSAAQTFALTGAYLTGANTTVIATGPYQVSKDGSTWLANITYTSADFPTIGTATVNVSVRFNPTVIAVGGVNNGSVTIANTSTTSQIVNLNGTGLALPVLTITPSTTIAFGNQSIAVASASKSFSLSGANLTANTTVSTTVPYGVSKDGLTFSTSISYTPTEIAATPTVYVNFNPTVVASTYPATITVASGTVSQTVTLTGAGIPPPNVAPTFAAIADQAVCYTTAVQTIPITGISPTESTQAITSISVTSSNPALFSQLGVVPLVTGATATQINYAIAAGASGTAVVTVTVKDNGGVLNGGIDTYVRTFNLTVNPLSVVSITASSNSVEKGQTVTLTATGGVTYSWTANSDIIGSTTGASIVVRPGTLTGTPLAPSKAPYTYTVTAYNATGCPTVQTYTVNTYNSQKLVASNIITPNGDGINDTWVVLNIELYPSNTVKIFDKAGKIVFTQSGYLNTWNGYGTDGSPLTQGTYYYVIDLGSGSKYSGFITLVRN